MLSSRAAGSWRLSGGFGFGGLAIFGESLSGTNRFKPGGCIFFGQRTTAATGRGGQPHPVRRWPISRAIQFRRLEFVFRIFIYIIHNTYTYPERIELSAFNRR